MSPDVVLLSSLGLAVTIGWIHRRYLDSTVPAQRKPQTSPPVVVGRELFGKPAGSGAGCRDAA